eukprot:1345275-Amphidinium_carterae.1
MKLKDLPLCQVHTASKLTTARNATGMRRGNGSRYLRRTIEFELNMTRVSTCTFRMGCCLQQQSAH